MKKVLIAEDDEILRKVIEIILINRDLQILYASSGTQAIDIALLEKPDLIVTKFKLPEINGIELLKRLKSEETTANIPVILIGANDEASEIKQGLEYGASTHITKPFSPMKFLTHIDLALKETQQ